MSGDMSPFTLGAKVALVNYERWGDGVTYREVTIGAIGS